MGEQDFRRGGGTGDGNVPQVLIKLGDNVFQASAFNEHLLAAFRLWIVAATPGDAATKAAIAKIGESTAAIEGVVAKQEDATEKLGGTAV